MPRSAPSGRPVRVGLALLVTLALATTWWLGRSARTRAPRTPAPAAPVDPRPPSDAAQPTLAPALPPPRSDLPAAAPHATLPSSAILLVRLASRTPLGDVTLTVVQSGGRSASEYLVAAGSSGLEIACPPGDVQVSARSAGPPTRVSLAAHATLQAGATELVELVLEPEAVFSATLQDVEGRLLEDLELHLRRRKQVLASARSDAAGRVLLAPLPAGEYELVLGALAGPLRPPELLQLEPGAASLTLTLPALLTLQLRVLDGQSQPVAGARLEGTGKPGGHLQGVTDADGLLRAAGLPPGDYRLFARHDALGRATRALALDTRTSSEVCELVLQR